MNSHNDTHQRVDSWFSGKLVLVLAGLVIAGSLATFMVTPIQDTLNRLVDTTGHYALVVMGLILAIRLALLPLSLKCERDKRMRESLSGRVADIKDELSEHPDAMSQATLQLYKRYKIRPIINALTFVFQVSLMLLFYSAVKNSTLSWSHDSLWFDAAPATDPLMIMPILASTLFFIVMASQRPALTVRWMVLYAGSSAALLWLLNSQSADTSVYLSAGMLLLLVQSALFRQLSSALTRASTGKIKTPDIKDKGFIPIAQAHHLPQSTGKQAVRLAQLLAAGYNVPAGFVFTRTLVKRIDEDVTGNKPLLGKRETRALEKHWNNLGTSDVTVLGSSDEPALASEHSVDIHPCDFNVTRDRLLDAVSQLYLSTGRTEADTTGGGVIVQKSIDAEYSGILFTEHPDTTGAMLLEFVEGSMQAIKHSQCTPTTRVVGKLTGALLVQPDIGSTPASIDMVPLLALGRELEQLFERAQNIQWAYANGKFFILQSHDITRLISEGDTLKNLVEQERGKLLQNLLGARRRVRNSDQIDPVIPVYTQNNHTAQLPRPTPLSAQLMQKLYSTGGSMDLACADLGIPYNVHDRSMAYTDTILGWSYVNRHEEKQRQFKQASSRTLSKITRSFNKAQSRFHDVFLPTFQQEMIERNAIAPERLRLDAATDILQLWIKRFVEKTHLETQRIQLAADITLSLAVHKLKDAGLEPDMYFSNIESCKTGWSASLLQHKANPELTGETSSIEEFLLNFGHRAICDYELAEPRFAEDQHLAKEFFERHTNTDQTPEEAALLPYAKAVKLSVQNARNFIQLKHEAEHYCMIELAQIRRLLIAIDDKLQLDGRIFQLTTQEIASLAERASRTRLLPIADERFEKAMRWKSLQLPASLSVHDLERIDMLTGEQAVISERGEICGTRVAGDSDIKGCVRVITHADSINDLKNGDILVARGIESAWHPLLGRAKGIISETGGWLSDTSIIARCHNLPCIVGVSDACQQLQSGDVVSMSLSGNITLISGRRRADTARQMAVTESATETLVADEDKGSAQSTNFEHTSDGRDQAASIYQLTSRKLFRYSQRMDRRAMKLGAGDRRAQPRYDTTGELQPDRRLSNDLVEAEKLRKAG